MQPCLGIVYEVLQPIYAVGATFSLIDMPSFLPVVIRHIFCPVAGSGGQIRPHKAITVKIRHSWQIAGVVLL